MIASLAGALLVLGVDPSLKVAVMHAQAVLRQSARTIYFLTREPRPLCSAWLYSECAEQAHS